MAEPQVALFIGSRSDMPVAEQAVQVLRGMEVPFSLNVAHAHHTARRRMTRSWPPIGRSRTN